MATITAIIQKIAQERPTTANDALMYLKQLFRHGIKLDLLASNPASAFTVSDAGGVELSKDRALTFAEMTKAFQLFRANSVSFTRDNYLACALLVTLGLRKSELCCTMWGEFELGKALWHQPEGRQVYLLPLHSLAKLWNG